MKGKREREALVHSAEPLCHQEMSPKRRATKTYHQYDTKVSHKASVSRASRRTFVFAGGCDTAVQGCSAQIVLFLRKSLNKTGKQSDSVRGGESCNQRLYKVRGATEAKMRANEGKYKRE